MKNVIFEPGTVYFAGDAHLALPKEARVYEAYRALGRFPDGQLLQSKSEPVKIGAGTYIGAAITIYEGTTIGPNVVLEDHIRIGFGCSLGPGARVMYGAYICDRVRIGSGTRIAGFICDAASVGANCTVMGNLVHKYTVPDLEWGEVDEPAPRISDDAIVGYGATIVGGITIASHSYVAAGAVVTKSVPENVVVTGTNRHTPIESWTGRELNDLFSRRGEHGA